MQTGIKFLMLELVNVAWLEFKSIFTSVLDSVAPVKEVWLIQRSEPWLTSEILDLIKTRDMFLYKLNKYNKSEFYKSFCLYRNMVQREIKTAKADYVSYKMEENKNISEKFVATN